jgi:hypothetical protein
MRLAIAAAITGALLLLAVPRNGEAEWFADFYLGKSFTLDSDLKIDQSTSHYTVKDLSFDDESFHPPPFYGARAGHFFGFLPWLGVAFDYFHFKMLADTDDSKRFVGTHHHAPIDAVRPVKTIVQDFNISHGVNYFTLNAVVRQGFFPEPERFPHGQLQGYLGVGPALIVAHPENEVDGVSNHQRYQYGGIGVHAFAGVKWLIFKYLGVFTEYKLTHSRLKVDLADGHAKVGETTHHIVFGVTVPIP